MDCQLSQYRQHNKENMIRHTIYPLIATLFILCPVRADVVSTEYPPVLTCEYEIDLSIPGYDYETGNPCFWVPSDRGYESLYVVLSPTEKKKGQCLVVWDISSGRKKVIVDNLDTRVGGASLEGQKRWRFTSVVAEDERARGRHLVFGLSGPNASGIIRFNMPEHRFSPFSKGPAGYEIIRLSGHGATPIVALLRKSNTHEYAFYRLEISQKKGEALVCRIAEELHRGGSELVNFFHAVSANKLFILETDGKATELSLGGEKVVSRSLEISAAQKALLQGRLRLLLNNQQIIGPRYYMLSTRQYATDQQTGAITPLAWSRTTLPVFDAPLGAVEAFLASDGPIAQLCGFKSMIRPVDSLRTSLGKEAGDAFEAEVFGNTPWRDGAIFKAAKVDDGKPHLLYLAPATGKVKDVGTMTTTAGKALDDVYWLGSDIAGMVMSLGKADGKLVAQVYRCPFLDSFVAVIAEARKRLFAGKQHSQTKVEVIDSFHAYGNEQDRGWDPYLAASDGNIYFGSMPHHPIKSTKIFRYEMGADTLTDLGAFDELAGLTGEKRIPNMMHCFPIEMDGKVYFVGQDPFYGKRRFPTLPADVGYGGSTVLAFDLKTKKFNSIGIPIPGGSLHGILPAYTRGLIYMKDGYHAKAWYGYDVATEKVRELKVPLVEKSQHIDAQGRMWMITKDGSVQCYDPGTDTVATLGSVGIDLFPEVKWIVANDREGKRPPETLPNYSARFVRATMGKDKAIGMLSWCEGVIELDTKTGSVRGIGRLRPNITNFPVDPAAGAFRAFDGVGGKLVSLCNKRNPRHVELHIMNLADGKATFHGILSDSTGRHVEESNCMTAGRDGNVYITATVFNNPGDKYFSHRFAWARAAYFDTIFARIVLP